jgi:hypothetical protein
MKNKSTPLVDEHLASLEGMQEVETDAFFYTRLKARLLARETGGEARQSQKGWGFPLKPVWVLGTLVLLLLLNAFILSNQFKSTETASKNNNPLKNFALSYDQAIYTTY